jgi:hypothetical protein
LRHQPLVHRVQGPVVGPHHARDHLRCNRPHKQTKKDGQKRTGRAFTSQVSGCRREQSQQV